MSEETIRKMLPTEPRIIDREAGIVEYVASSEAIDAHGDKILVAGWKFDRMRTNGPFLDSHRKGSVKDVLGRVLGARVEDGELVEKVQWAIGLGNFELDTAFRMTEAGFLKAVSVGFRPVTVVRRYLDRAQKKINRNFNRMVADYGVSEEEMKVLNNLFIEQQQNELSAVTIGANPDALLKSFETGLLGEEDLSKLGFKDDDAYDFLTKAAEAYESPECDDVLKLLMEREMHRQLSTGEAHENEPEAVDKGAGNEEREEFLKQLSDVTSKPPCTPSGGGSASRKVDGRSELLKALGE